MISPGPGTPRDAGVSMRMIEAFAGRVPIFGVCLGHQALVEVFGGKVVRAGRLMHGKTSPVAPRRQGRVRRACRRISRRAATIRLIADPASIPAVLEVTARTAQGEIMGVRHRSPADRGRAVPSGKRADAGGPDPDGQFSQDLSARCRIPAQILEHLARRARSERSAGGRAAWSCLTAPDLRSRHGRGAAGGSALPRASRPRKCAALPERCALWRASRRFPGEPMRSTSSARAETLPGASICPRVRRCSRRHAACR